MAVVMFASVAAACSKKLEKSETVPPGLRATSVGCQPVADRQQGYQNQYLPCGRYNTTRGANGYWAVTQDSTGWPSTASQQGPYSDPSRAMQFKYEMRRNSL
jgi:hypothetical protein